MPLMFRQITCLTGLAVAFMTVSLHADFTIDRIVPENAVVVMGVHNAEESLERFRNTPMHELLRAPEFSEKRDEFKQEFMAGMEEFLIELGVDADMRPWPTGTLGMSLYPVMDPELGTPALAMLAFAQFGGRADEVMQILDKGMLKAEEDGMMAYEQHDVLGRTVHVLDFAAVADAMEDEIQDDPFAMMLPDLSALFDSFQRMYLLREGDGFIIGSDLGSLTESLERMDRGEAGIGDREEYRRMLDQLGTNDAFGLLMTRELVQMISGVDQTGMMMMAGPMARAIFGDIRGIGTSMRLNSPEAMMEQKMTVYMPHGKGGLSRLFDVQTPREDLPSFTGPNSTYYTSVNLAFDKVADVLRDIIRGAPMIQMAVGDGFDQIEPMVREMTATLGPKMYFNSALTRPIALDSATTLFAIDCRDEQAYENIFAQFAPEMGLQPRDFLGHRIYSMDNEMNMMAMMTGMDLPISVGIGGGYVFFGTTPSVEQALRIVSQQDRLPTLADEPAYRRALASLPERPLVTWQYLDIVNYMEGSMRIMELRNAEMIERMREDFPELAAEMSRDGELEFDSTDIDWDVIRRYIGPSISYMESTDDGFFGVTYYLAAEPDDR